MPVTTKSFSGFVTDRTRSQSRIRRGFPPVARSHTRTVRSPLPEMTTGRPSSSADRHRVHRAGVAGERVADRGAGGQVPHPHRPVVAAGDDHRAAVQLGRPPPRVTQLGVAGERVADRGAGGQVPHPHRPSSLPETTTGRPSSSPTATAVTPPVWPVNGSPTGVPVARSHTRTVRSSLPETTTGRPSSSPTATAFTAPVWPVNGSPTGVPVARSHTRTVRSALPETTTGRPSSSADRHRGHPAGVAGERVADRVPVARS